MTLETVTLKLPLKLLQDAGSVAADRDVTIGHLVRHLLSKEVDRHLNPKTPVRADEGLLAALQALLARDMAAATDWADLATRLRRHGYELRPAGGGVVLYKSSCGSRICKGSELGFAYRTLVQRFQAGMPGHPHGGLDVVTARPPTALPLDSTTKGRLQRSLEPVFKTSPNWDILTARLLKRGYMLRPMGTGTAIYSTLDGRHLCNTKTVGYRYRALVKKFGAPMPGHPHGAAWVTSADTGQGDEPDFDVIERESPLGGKEKAPTGG